MPDGTVTGGFYNWNAGPSDPFFYDSIVGGWKVRTDKTTLISKMADYDDKMDTVYTNALNVLKDLNSKQNQVNTAAAALG